MSPQATEEVSYRIAVSFDGCESGAKYTSSVIRLAGDAGCHPPLEGRDFTRSPLRRTQKRNEFHPVLPLEGKVSPQATEEVSYRIAVSFVRAERLQSSKNIFHFLKIRLAFSKEVCYYNARKRSGCGEVWYRA